MIKIYLSELNTILLNMQNLIEMIGLILSSYFSIKIFIWNHKQKLILNSIKELYKLFEKTPKYK